MIGEREGTILEMLVREYIRTAEPVSSERVARRIRTVSPATVRNVFSDLTDDGYIEQPYISGGRIPRTPAYRFFVDRLLCDHDSVEPRLERIATYFEEVHRLQEEIAREFRVLSRFGDMMFGFDEVFSEPEFTEPRIRRELGQFLDEFDEHRPEYDKRVERNAFRVLIGDENNVQQAAHMSMVVGKNSTGDLFFIVGPTRMHYDRIIPFLKLWTKKPT